MVGGSIWKLDNSLDEAKDVMRPWQYQQEDRTSTDIPALCNHVVAFSSTSLIPWTVGSALVTVLQDILLWQTPVDEAVELGLCQHHSLMKGNSVVFGSVASPGHPVYHLYARAHSETNLFGLQFPMHCKECQARTSCHSGHSKTHPRGKCRIICTEQTCRWGTQWFIPPKQAIVKRDRFLMRWRLPLAAQEWNWIAPRQVIDNTPYAYEVTELSFISNAPSQ